MTINHNQSCILSNLLKEQIPVSFNEYLLYKLYKTCYTSYTCYTCYTRLVIQVCKFFLNVYIVLKLL